MLVVGPVSVSKHIRAISLGIELECIHVGCDSVARL